MSYFNKITNKNVYLVENIIVIFSIFWFSLVVFNYLPNFRFWLATSVLIEISKFQLILKKPDKPEKKSRLSHYGIKFQILVMLEKFNKIDWSGSFINIVWFWFTKFLKICECQWVVKFLLKNFKTWIFVEHRLFERFCVVTISKFSLFSACKSVHRVERF